MPAIGIDLGTTFSCVAIWYQGKVEILANGLGSRTTPSWVAFTDNERLIGEPARNQAARNPTNTIYDIKRLIGRRLTDSTVQQDIRRWPFRVVDDRGKPTIEVTEHRRLHRLSPVEISAMIVDHMRTIAEKFLGSPITDAVITVPAYFNDAQRQATKDAGLVAGLNVLRILNEPTAAALAYGQFVEPLPSRNVLVFDLGGGTFDVSILTILNGLEFEVLATAGDTHLGGQDFDNLIVEYFAELVEKKTGVNVRSNARAMTRLKTAAEKAKHNLSFSTEVNVEVDVLIDSYDFHTKLSRARFEDLCAPLFAQTFDPVRQALADANLLPEQIDDVVLVGGSSRIPKIQDMLRSFFKDKPLSVQINPEEAVATGAAIQAAILIHDDSWVIQNLVLRDIIPLSLGIGLEDGGVKRIVARNSHIPSVHSGGTKTCIDDQTAVLFEVYEGERPLARDNNLLGSYVIDDIPHGPRGAIKFDTTFSIDEDGILTVKSRERRTGRSQQITIGSDEHRWTRSEVHAMLREAQYYKRADDTMRQRLSARRALETRAFEIKQAVNSPIAASVLTSSELVQMRNLYQAELDWLDADADSMMEVGAGAPVESSEIEQRIAALEERYRPFEMLLEKAGSFFDKNQGEYKDDTSDCVNNPENCDVSRQSWDLSESEFNQVEPVCHHSRVGRVPTMSPIEESVRDTWLPLPERTEDDNSSPRYSSPRKFSRKRLPGFGNKS